MGLRTHQLKVDSREALHRLRIAMTDADDYAPEDTDARDRSDQAKKLAALAEKEHIAGRYTEAIDAANNAMRIMEGN